MYCIVRCFPKGRFFFFRRAMYLGSDGVNDGLVCSFQTRYFYHSHGLLMTLMDTCILFYLGVGRVGEHIIGNLQVYYDYSIRLTPNATLRRKASPQEAKFLYLYPFNQQYLGNIRYP